MNALLASMLFAIYLVFSQVLYLEFVTFTIILISLCIPKWDNVWIVVTFVILVWLTYGISIWSIMYLIIYPGFALLLNLLKGILTKNIYHIAIAAAIMGFLAGNLIDLPLLLFAKEIVIAYWLIGLKTTLIQGVIAFITVLLLYEPMAKNLKKLILKGTIYD